MSRRMSCERTLLALSGIPRVDFLSGQSPPCMLLVALLFRARLPPLLPPTSMLIFFLSSGVAIGWHASLSTLSSGEGESARTTDRSKIPPSV